MRFYVFILTLAVGLVLSCGSDDEPPLAPQSPDDGREHVAVGDPHSPYSTTPATSGPHWSIGPVEGAPKGSPVNWGIYRDPLPDEVLVHNLEHGGVALLYDCPEACPNLIQQIDTILLENQPQLISAPYSGMTSKIALTAWRRLLLMEEFDEAQILSFIETHRDGAPESVSSNPSESGAGCGLGHGQEDSQTPGGGTASSCGP